MLNLQRAGQQADKEQDHTDHTGREGKGQDLLRQHAEPAHRKDDPDLFNNFHIDIHFPLIYDTNGFAL